MEEVTRDDIEFAGAIVDRHGKLACRGCIAIMAAVRFNPLRRRLAAAQRSLSAVFAKEYALAGEELEKAVALSIDISAGALLREEEDGHA